MLLKDFAEKVTQINKSLEVTSNGNCSVSCNHIGVKNLQFELRLVDHWGEHNDVYISIDSSSEEPAIDLARQIDDELECFDGCEHWTASKAV